MVSKSLLSLLQRVGRGGQTPGNSALGIVIALFTPALALLAGGILSCLIGAQQSSATVSRFARILPNPADFFASQTAPLARASFLLAVVAVLVCVSAVLLFIFYRQVQSQAVGFEADMISLLREHAKRLARTRTLSAQQQALTDSLNYHLPRVRASLARWWRTFPRHGVQFVACILVAFLIEPLLAVLTLIAMGLILLTYRYLDRSRRTALPVVRERASQQREELIQLSLKGPLLESVHEEHEVERRFKDQLAYYQRDAFKSLASSVWKTPTVVLMAGVFLCLFLFVVAVQIIGQETAFGIAGVFTFTLCCVGAAVSMVRLQRSWRELKTVETAADELEQFLSIPVEEIASEDLKPINQISKQAELEHVTVKDSRGRKLLENVSVLFDPGRLIGVVASQPLQANALVELLMGFGRPVSGRMLVDGDVITDLEPNSLATCAHWVAADGAVVTGTVKDNLLASAARNGAVELESVLKTSKLAEAVQQLPEGLATVITPDDDRLSADAPFRLGLARAALCSPSVIVIEEPKGGNYDQDAENQTLEAIKSLVDDSTITVVLPQRLGTLRNCDSVVVLHEHKVIDAGLHSELLQRNELYRHLNYLKFNPFRKL